MVQVRPPVLAATVYEVTDPPESGVMLTPADPSPAVATGAVGRVGVARNFCVKLEVALPPFAEVRGVPSPKFTDAPTKSPPTRAVPSGSALTPSDSVSLIPVAVEVRTQRTDPSAARPWVKAALLPPPFAEVRGVPSPKSTDAPSKIPVTTAMPSPSALTPRASV